MPYGILRSIASGYKGKKSPEEAQKIAYATANKYGFMHGSKETELGQQKEAKFEHDHPKSDTRPFKKSKKKHHISMA